LLGRIEEQAELTDVSPPPSVKVLLAKGLVTLHTSLLSKTCTAWIMTAKF
jgi:hypothetical protein